MSTVLTALFLVGSVVILSLALLVLRESKATLKTSEMLIRSLQVETLDLVKEATSLLVGTKRDVSRVEDLLEMSELRAGALNEASRVAIGAIAAPIVRFRALKLGVHRARTLFGLKRRRR